MAFSLKTWVNRISEYSNRRKLTHEDGSTELVTVARAEGQISAEGNAFSAEEMNDLENRIKGGFDEVNQSLGTVTSFDIKSGYSIRESSARRTLKICTINLRIRKDDGFGTGFVEMANIIGKDNYPAMPISVPCSIVTTDSGRCLGSGEVQINTDGKIKVRAADSTKNIAYSEASINAIWICP